MLGINNRNYVALTHIPTGICVMCDQHRSQHQNRATAYRRLRSRLFAEMQGIVKVNEVVATYLLPDNTPYPNDLDDYKRILQC